MAVQTPYSWLEQEARDALEGGFGAGASASVAHAPGRCTLVGEHVDYAGGLVLAYPVNLFVAVALRPSTTGQWGVVSRGRRIVRGDTKLHHDIGDRTFGVGEALRQFGIDVPAMEIGVAASLPEGAGLSSSAAVTVATMLAMLRASGNTMTQKKLAEAAIFCEQEVVGVPTGALDQRTIIHCPGGNALLLDFTKNVERPVPWTLTDTAVIGCYSGQKHDVGAGDYEERRDEVLKARRELGTASWRDVTLKDVEKIGNSLLRARARHVVSETDRAQGAAFALAAGDAAALGALMSLSHTSLRSDFEVVTPALDEIVQAALEVEGCYGARMVGAGFGGTAIALVAESAMTKCQDAMSHAAMPHGGGQAWALRPTEGVSAGNHDVLGGVDS